MSFIKFHFRKENNRIIIHGDKSELEDKLNYLANKRGVYIWTSEGINWCKCESVVKESFKSSSGDKEQKSLGYEFKEKNTGNENCKFNNWQEICSKSVILIGKADEFRRRIIYFLASLIDNHDILPNINLFSDQKNKCNKVSDVRSLGNIDEDCRGSLHSEGARIRKLVDECYRNQDLEFSLCVYIIETPKHELLEACLLHAFKSIYKCLPLFNKKLEYSQMKYPDCCKDIFDEIFETHEEKEIFRRIEETLRRCKNES